MSTTPRQSLKKKLIVLLLAIGLIPLAITNFLAIIQTKQAVEENVQTRLMALEEGRKDGIETYGAQIVSQVRTLSQNNAVVSAMRDFRRFFPSVARSGRYEDIQTARKELVRFYESEFGRKYREENPKLSLDLRKLHDLPDEAIALQHAYIASNPNPLGEKNALDRSNTNTPYDAVHGRFHHTFNSFLNEFGYYDIFLVEPREGNIVYSVYKELDFATSLFNGPYADSNFAEVVRRALKLADPNDYVIEDFRLYTPSYEAPASFIASPIADNSGTVLGVLVFQMPVDRITAVMSGRNGLGETGESYLVGPDATLRSDTHLAPDTYNVVNVAKNASALRLKTESVSAAIAGKQGVSRGLNYAESAVVSAYGPLNFAGLSWGIVVEQSEDEAYGIVGNLIMTETLAALGFAALIAFVAFRFARQVTAPVAALEKTISSVAASGNFNQQAEFESNDEIGAMGDALNGLLRHLRSAIDEANQVVSAVATGDFSQRIEGIYPGDLETLKQGVNGSADSVEQTMSALGEVMQALSQGDFSKRMSEQVEPGFRDQVDNAMQSVQVALQSVAGVMAEVAKGNLQARVEGQLPGDLAAMQRDINRSLDAITSVFTDVGEVMQTMTQGDFTRSITADYEGDFERLKQNINATQTQLQTLIGNIKAVVEDVTAGVESVAEGNSELKARSEKQAASLEQTAATMEQMTSAIEKSAEGSSSITSLSENARSSAEQARTIVREAIDAITAIEASSRSMSDIIGVIDEIAFQTNLLALNASVEAARAGEQGRGFAVVANEVRNLAQRSASAAKEISDLIKRSSKDVGTGTEQIGRTGEAFEEMITTFVRMNEMVKEVSLALNEQTTGVRQVNQSIASLDTITQQNAELANDATQATQEILMKARALASDVNQLRT